jgi:hypothetical protein
MAKPADTESPDNEGAPPIDQEEVDHVLASLRILKKQVAHPVVRECLEAVRADIAHLAAAGESQDDEDDFDDFDEEEEDDAFEDLEGEDEN